MDRRVSTGIAGFDKVIDMFRLGDNVVWQVQSIQEYKSIVSPYVAQSLEDGRRLIYIRFGQHEPVAEALS